MREIDQMAIESVNDDRKLTLFIEQNELFILRTASKFARQYVSKQDDEWAVALVAFSGAVKKYDFERGSFFSFAEMLISRSLIDHFRIRSRRSLEIPVEAIEDEAITVSHDNELKVEIEILTEILKNYEFGFMDLPDSSPKADKTKKACAKAVSFISKNPILMQELRITKNFPAKIIEKNTGVPRKIMERHRKYLIAAAEILHGDFPCLADYLSDIKKEGE